MEQPIYLKLKEAYRELFVIENIEIAYFFENCKDIQYKLDYITSDCINRNFPPYYINSRLSHHLPIISTDSCSTSRYVA